MPENRPLTILCVTSYEKGQEFLRTCKSLGCRVLLLTVEKLRDAAWPREAIDEVFLMPEELPLQHIINTVSYIARFQHIDRVVALDEFDMENVSALREHLRIPGMGLTTVRYFRDKLAMRILARESGILVPEFAHVLHHGDLRDFMARVPGPWLLKPRSQASGIGMKKVEQAQDLWPWLDQLGDHQSNYLLEQFLPGGVYHVDSIVSERNVVFAEAHAYGMPPLDVSHHGGVFTSGTMRRDSPDAVTLLEVNRKLITGLGLLRGVTHAEFLKSKTDGRFYFIEIAARVGGAYISDVVEAATGINLWREWARLEIGAGKNAQTQPSTRPHTQSGTQPHTPAAAQPRDIPTAQTYTLPETRRDYGGVILSLARQEHPDTSAYTDPEIVYRVSKYHHAGFVLRSPEHHRLQELLCSYSGRFATDFLATQPVPEKPTS